MGTGGESQTKTVSDPDLTQIIAALAAFVRQLFDFDCKTLEGPPIDFNNYKKPEEPPIKNTIRLSFTQLLAELQPEKPLIENTVQVDAPLLIDPPIPVTSKSIQPYQKTADCQKTANDDPVQVSKSYQKVTKTQRLGC